MTASLMTGSAPQAKRSVFKSPQIWILAAVFILWRLTYLTFTHPAYFPDNYEEIYRGTVAHEILSRTPLSLWDYRPDNYAGGFYGIVILIAGFFKLFGTSMLSFKSVSIFTGTLTLMTWVAILKEYVNSRASWLFGLLFIFAPYPVTGLFSAVLGDHAETCLLSAVTVLLVFKLYDENTKSLPLLICLGFLAGFGLWFAYIYGITLLAITLFLLTVRFRVKGKAALYFLASFAAGFSFWLITNLRSHFQGVVVRGMPVWTSFSAANLLAPFQNWKNFFIARLFFETPGSGLHSSFYFVTLAIYAVLAVTLIGLSFLNPNDSRPIKKNPETLFLIYGVLFLLVSQAYEDVGLRYWIPGFPFFAAWTAAQLSKTAGVRKKAAYAVMTGLIITAIFSITTSFSFKHRGEFLKQKAYSFQTLPMAPGPMNQRIESLLNNAAPRMTPQDQKDLVMAFTEKMILSGDLESEIFSGKKLIPPGYADFYYSMIGRQLVSRSHDLNFSLKQIESLKINHPREYRRISYAILDSTFLQAPESLLNASEMDHSEDPWRSSYAVRSEGFLFARGEISEGHDFDRFLNDLSEAKNLKRFSFSNFLEGIGCYTYLIWKKNPLQPAANFSVFRNLPRSIQEPLETGIGQQMAEDHLASYRSPLGWEWREWRKILDGEMELIKEGFHTKSKALGLPSGFWQAVGKELQND